MPIPEDKAKIVFEDDQGFVIHSADNLTPQYTLTVICHEVN